MKVLSSKKAEGYIMPCVLIIVLAAIFSGIFVYSASLLKVNVMKENSKIVLDSFVTQKATEIFNSIKQGNDYTEVIDQSRYQSALINFCTLERDGENLYSTDTDGKEQFHISEPVISFKAEHELKLCVSYTMSVPIYFAGAYITSASIPVEVSSVLTEKF